MKPLAPPKPTPIRANRAGEMLRKLFNLAIAWKMRPDNPALGFRRRMEAERERLRSMDAIARLGDALAAAEDQRAAAIIRMCMLTGARLGEVRTPRFEHFDLERAIWTKPAADTNQRRIHRVPVLLDTVALVRTRKGAVPAGCDWLFPGDVEGKDQPVQELRRFWIGIQQAAEIPDVRIHDLRHTFASLEMIGILLGHSQSRTTQRYAHLIESPLRASVDAAADLVRPRPRLVHVNPPARMPAPRLEPAHAVGARSGWCACGWCSRPVPRHSGCDG